MSRTRVGVGLVAVAAGAAWAAGGGAALRAAMTGVVTVLPFLLIAAGLALLLRALVPRGALAGPLILILIGGVWLVAAQAPVRSARIVLSTILIAGGAAIAMSHRSEEPRIDTGVERYTALVVPRTVSRDRLARKLIVRALLGNISLDLGKADYANAKKVEIDVTILYGRVELTLPKNPWRCVEYPQ